ncbi:MAG: hypothetical protein WCP32_02335 [Bacteroidota bacterium]
MNKTTLLIILTGLLILSAFHTTAQVAINSNGNPPDISAMLDISSSNRGFLPPRLTLTAANSPAPIAAPAPGLLVYNTLANGTAPNRVASGYYSWSGSRWIPVSPPVGSNSGDMAYWNGSDWIIIPAGAYGESMVFCNGVPTWGGCLPLVSTNSVTNIVQTTATAGGNVTSEGGTAVTTRGVCWDTVNNPDTTRNHVAKGAGPGVYKCTMTGLSLNKTYFVRAYATNSRGTAYGAEKSFITGCMSYNNVSITIVASENPIAAGTSVDFTATPVKGGEAPEFQWKVNDVNAGTNSNVFSYLPNNNDVITCILTSSLTGCVAGNPATSNSITLGVNP